MHNLIELTNYKAFSDCNSESSVLKVIDNLWKSRDLNWYRHDTYPHLDDDDLKLYDTSTDIRIGHDHYGNDITIRVYGTLYEYYYYDDDDDAWYHDYSTIEWEGWDLI